MNWRIRYPKIPDLKTPLPGPKAAALIADDAKYLSPSYTRAYPLAVKRGEGAAIEDLDGNVFLDFTAGIAVCSTGHCHPRVVEAVRRQAGELLHMSGTDFYYAPQRDLAAKLATLAPGPGAKKVFFSNSGAEAVEAAFKLARFHTRRPYIVSFLGGFHGRTMGALSLTASKATQRRGFAPLVPGAMHVEYGHCFRCPLHRTYGDCGIACVHEQLESFFRRILPPEEVAAVVVEPVQGEGGYIVPPPEFLPELQAVCREHGILLIVDEVQSGMGRTGKMFAVEHWGVEPDVVCLAKGIASGLPLGATIARSEIMSWPRGAHASTFGGNPVACVAALETVALLEEGLTANAAEVGAFLLERLRGLQKRCDRIGDVRGLGLMIGVEVVRGDGDRSPDPQARDAWIRKCFEKGLLLLGCGESAVRLCPPLIVSRDDADACVRIMVEALEEIESPLGSAAVGQ
jgi:4-aminobutyrate aminotransferase